MNQFYEQELPDISKEMDSSREILNKQKKPKGGAEKRRYMKKNPEQKAKDVIIINFQILFIEIMGKYH